MATKKSGTKGRATRKSERRRGGGSGRSPGVSGRELALAIAEAGLDKKALNVEIIDVRGKVDYADYVIVMSGRSDRQVNAIAHGIEEHLKKSSGVRCLGLEGLPQGSWVLMDFGEAIVHIFHQDTRGYYDLESLWIDAARLDLEQQSA